MRYKDDWQQAQARMLAWWEREIVDRPCIQVTAPRAGMEAERAAATTPPPGVSLEQWWTDVGYIVDRASRAIAATYYGGESFPLFNPNLGPDLFAAYLGAEVRLQDYHTNWVVPFVDDWATALPLRLDEGNRWWRLQVDLLTAAQDAGRGLWLTGLPDTHAGGDAYSAIRGRRLACTDLYDNPEAVRRAMSDINDAMRRAYDAYLRIVEPERYGSSSGWLPAWHTGRANALQCDFIGLISPPMMREFILDGIVAEARCLDRGIYHLDGPSAIPHLDTLLQTPEIHAIQWVYGAGNEPATRWVPFMRRIQAGGKGVWIDATPAEVPVLLEYLDPRGLMIHTSTDTEQEARDLVAQVERAWGQRA
ncbi:MAG: hypothetical protein ACYC5O_01190 [Anaerolineae bacterium]